MVSFHWLVLYILACILYHVAGQTQRTKGPVAALVVLHVIISIGVQAVAAAYFAASLWR
jgi:hypothetical protein